MPRTFRQSVHAMRQKALLDAAVSMIAADGRRAFSSGRLVAEAGVGKGTLYAHFPSQTACVEAALAQAGRTLIETIDGLDAEDPEERLLAAVSAVLTGLNRMRRGTLAAPCCFSRSPCPFKSWTEVENRLRTLIEARLVTPAPPAAAWIRPSRRGSFSTCFRRRSNTAKSRLSPRPI